MERKDGRKGRGPGGRVRVEAAVEAGNGQGGRVSLWGEEV